MTLISSYINKYPDVKVLCVGDIMLDEFVYGSVGRISPEAPVPVINPKTTKEIHAPCARKNGGKSPET